MQIEHFINQIDLTLDADYIKDAAETFTEITVE